MRRRIRAAWATLSSAPWRRAPWLLRRRPGVLATVAGACAVLAAAVASVPLFLSSAGTESIAVQADERCPRDMGATYNFIATAQGVASPPRDPFAPLADTLGPTSRWARFPGVLVGADPTDDTRVVVLTRNDALEHVDVIEGSPGPGLWITDRAARITGLGSGDQATISGVAVPVAGVYRDLAGTSFDDYWCSHVDVLLPEGPGAEPRDPVLLADQDTFAQLMGALHIAGAPPAALGAWEVPLRRELTMTDAEALIRDLACNGAYGTDLHWCTQPTALVEMLGALFPEPIRISDDARFVTELFASSLPFAVERTRGIQTSVGGGVWPVAAFAALAGAGLVAAAASLWFDRRRREVTLLTVRGVSPTGLGTKAVL
jgi:putative ABC transport system permease protein